MRTDYKPAGPSFGYDRWRAPFRVRASPQTTAWAILWVAFAVFCALVAGAAYGVKEYYDKSTLTGSATLSLEEGIVLLRDAVTSALVNAPDNLSLREGDRLILGQGARASISVLDGSRVVLYPATTLHIQELRVSRFHNNSSQVALFLEKGTARVSSSLPSSETQHFLVVTPHGVTVLDDGNFGIQVSDSQTRVASRWGVATVSSEAGQVPIGAGQKALLKPAAVEGPLPEGDQLVSNGDFTQGFSGWRLLDINEQGRPLEPGQRALVTEKINGRDILAMRVSRASPSSTHNETGLIQGINRDVSDYEALLLTATLKVSDQSLSGGGYLGYEYPVMIRVRYRTATGEQIDWSHGFFYQNPENRPTPNGQQVPKGQWIEYDGNLMHLREKPAHIISIEVLGAGHTFDGLIGDISLIGK
jgi:hypothetical protein